MGFWSSLGSIAGLVAAPFTGGATAALLPALGAAAGGLGDAIAGKGGQAAGDVGTVMGSDAAAAAKGRLAEAQATQGQDRNAMERYAMMLKAPSTATSQAVRGSLIQNMQDAHVTPTSGRVPVPQMSGGLRPSAMGDGGRQAGAGLFANAMGNLNAMKPGLTPPELTPLPQASTMDNINKIGGRVGSIVGAISPYLGSGGFNPQYSGATGGADPTHGAGFNPEDPLNADPQWWEGL